LVARIEVAIRSLYYSNPNFQESVKLYLRTKKVVFPLIKTDRYEFSSMFFYETNTHSQSFHHSPSDGTVMPPPNAWIGLPQTPPDPRSCAPT
jgi:hypothetical protein